MARSLTLTTAPTTTPITLAEAKAQIRLESSMTEDDALVTGLIEAATDMAESETGLQLVTATWQLALDSFSEIGQLPKVPAASIVSIKYDDTDGNEQTLASSVYGLQAPLRTAGSVYLKDAQAWPSDVHNDPGSVRIEYTAGYGAAADVPSVLKCGIKLIIGHLYENREATVPGVSITELPMGVQACFAGYSVAEIPT